MSEANQDLKIPVSEMGMGSRATSLRRVRYILETSNTLMLQKITRAWGCGYTSRVLAGYAITSEGARDGQEPEEGTNSNAWVDADDLTH